MFNEGDFVTIRPEATVLTNFPQARNKVGEVILTGGRLFDYLVYFAGGLELHLDEHELEKYVPPTDKD